MKECEAKRKILLKARYRNTVPITLPHFTTGLVYDAFLKMASRQILLA